MIFIKNMKIKLKPIIKYVGGKLSELEIIAPYFPYSINTYVEAFLGGGAVFFYLRPQKAIINDINLRLYNFYKGLIENSFNIREQLDDFSYRYNNADLDTKEKMYYEIRSMYNKHIPSEYDYSTLYYIINKLAYAGMVRFNNNDEFNVPFGRYKTINNNITEEHVSLLQRVKLYNKDYSEVILEAKKDDFVFLDPPYHQLYTEYGNGFEFPEEKQIELSELFKKSPANCMIVINKTDLISELYKDYIKKEYSKTYSINFKNRNERDSKHLIITNYDNYYA